MKHILLFFIFSTACFSQNTIIDDNEGLRIIFSPNESFTINTFKAYFPTQKEILKLEKDFRKLINKKITSFKEANSENNNDEDWANVNMINYVRQYSGFVNSNNEKIIFINFLCKKDIQNDNTLDFKNKWILKLPCCKSYIMTYNSKKRTFSDLNFIQL
ncbi:MAG: hypothetical protein V4548_01470 [Bacteroidota bacterium]